MVNGIGGSGGFARDAIQAALSRSAEAASRMDEAKARLQGGAPEAKVGGGFETSLTSGIQEVDQQMKLNDQLVEGLVTGQVTEFAEVAAQVKQADLAFKFALSVRNKFVDAYREVMRMNV